MHARANTTSPTRTTATTARAQGQENLPTTTTTANTDRPGTTHSNAAIEQLARQQQQQCSASQSLLERIHLGGHRKAPRHQQTRLHVYAPVAPSLPSLHVPLERHPTPARATAAAKSNQSDHSSGSSNSAGYTNNNNTDSPSEHGISNSSNDSSARTVRDVSALSTTQQTTHHAHADTVAAFEQSACTERSFALTHTLSSPALDVTATRLH